MLRGRCRPKAAVQTTLLTLTKQTMKAVIFDVDGTLVQSMAIDCELYTASIQAVLGPVRFRPTFNAYDNVTDSGILNQVFVDNSLAHDARAIKSIKSHFVNSLIAHINSAGPFTEIRGATQIIDRLRRSAGHCLAIATGCWRESAVLKLENSGFDIADLLLVTCDDSPSRTEIMRTALSRLGEKFDSVTYFGDAEWDRDACRNLGWNFIAVGTDLGGIDSYEGLSV